MPNKGIKYTINFRRIAIGLAVPHRLKPSRFHVPNRSGLCASFRQGNLGGKNRSNSLVNWAKWSNDAMMRISFLATYFHNPCSVVYFSLISSSYIKRKITNVNNVTWTNTFNVHLNTYLRLLFFYFFFYFKGKEKKKKVSLSVLGAAKTESGYNTRCKSFCSAMIGACAKWTALMNRPENNFRLWDRQKFNFRPNHTCQTRV